jgi:hypothetical protein
MMMMIVMKKKNREEVGEQKYQHNFTEWVQNQNMCLSMYTAAAAAPLFKPRRRVRCLKTPDTALGRPEGPHNSRKQSSSFPLFLNLLLRWVLTHGTYFDLKEGKQSDMNGG